MLTDPVDGLAEQSGVVHVLVGLAGLAGLVRVLAADGAGRSTAPAEADDVVHLLLGVASVGDAVGRLVPGPAPVGHRPPPREPRERWLR